MKKFLCTPCAETLKATRKVTVVPGNREKITCAKCKRRRYGQEYQVHWKTKKPFPDGRPEKAKEK